MPSAPAHYARVKQHLLEGMARGDWAAGARLPSESELVAQFGLSRMTVNRALRELAAEGRITRVAGVGSFVAEPKVQSTLLRIASIASDIRARGHGYQCEMLDAQALPASPEAAQALGVRSGTPLFHALCLHRENGVPVQLEDRWVSPAAAPRFLQQDWGATTPSDYLVRGARADGAPWSCRIVANPLGYARKGEQATFQPHCVLTV